MTRIEYELAMATLVRLNELVDRAISELAWIELQESIFKED